MNGYLGSLVLVVHLLRFDAAPHLKIPLQVTFHNTGPRAVRLLDTFERQEALVFFQMKLHRSDGTIVLTRGGGKIDFGPGKIRYQAIEPGASFSPVIDLAAFVGDVKQIPPGHYTLKVTYTNQYGSDCFKGTIVSERAEIVIPPYKM